MKAVLTLDANAHLERVHDGDPLSYRFYGREVEGKGDLLCWEDLV